MLRIDHSPGHCRRTGPMLCNEAGCVTVRLAIEHVIDVTLPEQRNVACFVACDFHITHAPKQRLEDVRVCVGEFDELEPVGPGWVRRADTGGRRVVRERTHSSSSVIAN